MLGCGVRSPQGLENGLWCPRPPQGQGIKAVVESYVGKSYGGLLLWEPLKHLVAAPLQNCSNFL